MDAPQPLRFETQLVDIEALRVCGIFPKGNEPSIRTLREWTKLRRIPSHRVGHFVYYDPAEVSYHIRTRLRVPARGEEDDRRSSSSRR
jgi:hypothetical protein